MTYVNKGDYGYWSDAGSIKDFDGNASVPDRDFYINGAGMRNVIFPANPVRGYEGDIVPIGDNEGRQFAYAWWRDSKDSEARDAYGRLRAKGYQVATTDHFRIVREAFFEENGRICSGDTILMACTAERWEEEKAKEEKNRRRSLGQELDNIDDEFSKTVERTLGNTGIRLEPITEAAAKATKRK